MVNYQNGKIYGIYEGDTLLYIGSTCKALSNRFSDHKSASKTDKDKGMRLYRYINERHEKWDGVYIELIENYPCDTKEQLNRREGELIRERATPLNKIIIGRTRKEYYEDNIEKILEHKREKYKEKSEAKKEYQRKYYYRQKVLSAVNKTD